jgi:NTP pyrophosphatase (non-canonical NTP hydrolase)
MTVGETFESWCASCTDCAARVAAPGTEQTHDSIKGCLIEEAYEVLEAIEAQDDGELCTELGDLLLQIVFHAEMAAEAGRFEVSDVIRAISAKMTRRHPHVFGDTQVSGAADVLRNWSRIKSEERQDSADSSALAGVPRAMPALLHAQRLGEKAGHAGFDWPNVDDVLDKLREELGELQEAVPGGPHAEAGSAICSTPRPRGAPHISAEDALKAPPIASRASVTWRPRWPMKNAHPRRGPPSSMHCGKTPAQPRRIGSCRKRWGAGGSPHGARSAASMSSTTRACASRAGRAARGPEAYRRSFSASMRRRRSISGPPTNSDATAKRPNRRR